MPTTPFEKGKSGNPVGRPPGKNLTLREKYIKKLEKENIAELKKHLEQYYDVGKILEKMGCNPFEILGSLCMYSDSEKIRCTAASELARYICPQLKSIEHKGIISEPVKFIFNNAPLEVSKDESKS